MFSSHEIATKTFVIDRKGYDPDEVGAFLRAIAADFSELRDRLESSKREDPVERISVEVGGILESARASAAAVLAKADADAASRLEAADADAASRLEKADNEAAARIDEADREA